MKHLILASLFISSFAYANPSQQCSEQAVKKVIKECQKEWRKCELNRVLFVKMDTTKISYKVELTALGYDMLEDWDQEVSIKYSIEANGIVCP